MFFYKIKTQQFTNITIDFYVLDQVAGAPNLSQFRYHQNILLDKDLGDYSWSEANWQALANERDYLLINLVQNECLIGLLLAKLNYLEEMAHLLKIIVTTEKRKQGLGRLLMNELENFMKSKKLTKLFLEVEEDNESAIALYKKMGINKICLKKRFYSNGKNAWKMLKENNG